MTPDRITLLSIDLWDHVFHTLDVEPETDGELGGVVATAVDSAFRSALEEELSR